MSGCCIPEALENADFEVAGGTGGFVEAEGTGGGVDLAAEGLPLLPMPLGWGREVLAALPPVLFGVTFRESELNVSTVSCV